MVAVHRSCLSTNSVKTSSLDPPVSASLCRLSPSCPLSCLCALSAAPVPAPERPTVSEEKLNSHHATPSLLANQMFDSVGEIVILMTSASARDSQERLKFFLWPFIEFWLHLVWGGGRVQAVWAGDGGRDGGASGVHRDQIGSHEFRQQPSGKFHGRKSRQTEALSGSCACGANFCGRC